MSATMLLKPLAATPRNPGQPRLFRRAGMALLILLTGTVMLLSALPVILLFFITAVPVWIAGLLLLLDIGLAVAGLRLARTPLKWVGTALAFLLVALLAVVLSQRFAATPAITDTNGQVIPGSIASLETVELNGSTQWITIRGESPELPVLLFLAGGPGGSELVMTRRYLGALEHHFIVVNWDQAGTGKSYRAVDFEALTVERYVADAYALTQYLRERFDEEKIYVFGESWGSILGVMLVQQHPEQFHALITTGQMVDPVENDVRGYKLALTLLTEQGRLAEAGHLLSNDKPPYPSEVLIGKFGAINDVLNDYMAAHAHGEGTGHNLLLDSLVAPEYGLLDKVNWLLGLAQTFTTVYPQLYDVDFRQDASELDVPVYFIKGRWDVNADNALAEEYFALLQAPHKEWIWFEDSAHTPSWDEPDHFVEVMVNMVLAQTTRLSPE